MSIQRYETADGTRWRVRWRDASGKMHSRSFTSKSEAKACDTDTKARKLRSEVLPVSRSYTLNQAWEDWRAGNRSSLSVSTLAAYEGLWRAHIEGSELAATSVGALVSDPKLIDDHLNALEAKGTRDRRLPRGERRPLGDASKRRLLMMLSGIFKECVRWRKVSINPIREMRKPPGVAQRKPRFFPPLLVERIRCQLRAQASDEFEAETHAVFVALLAYAGLRPQEALALEFRDVGENTLNIHKAIKQGVDGTIVGSTKTKKDRAVPLSQPLYSDLAEWRQLLGDPSGTSPILPSSTGDVWTVSMYRNWRQRAWKPALKELAASDPNLSWLVQSRPYDCRGSFVSLHLRAGVPPVEIADSAGHSLDVLYRHYASVIDELKGQPQSPAEQQIARARALMAEETEEEVAELTAESLKPPKEVPPDVQAILYGRHPRRG